MTGALDGIVVADFSRVLAGPLAAMILGDLGATVVKVERPGSGDDTRGWSPPVTPDGEATYFLAANRNKRSIALDLADPGDQATARALVAKADVLVENFPPGTMERFGLGYEDLRRDHPGLVYASVTGFGRRNPQPGYDFLVQAVGGLMSITGDPGGEPTKVGVALVDVLAGQNLVTGVLAALLARARTGRGQRVDVTLLGTLLAALANQATAHLAAGVTPTRMGNRHPSITPYETLRTADRPIAVAVGNDAQFARLAAALGVEVNGFTTNADRVRRREALIESLESRLATAPAQHWLAVLTEVGVACGPVNSVPEGFALAERLGLAPVVEGRVPTVANPVALSDTPATYRHPPPRLNEHEHEVRALIAGQDVHPG